jgi:hypothetical protein
MEVGEDMENKEVTVDTLDLPISINVGKRDILQGCLHDPTPLIDIDVMYLTNINKDYSRNMYYKKLNKRENDIELA